MRIIDARGKALNVSLARAAVAGLPKHAIARMHPAQESAWEMLGLVIAEVVTIKPSLDAWMPTDRIRTVGGHRIVSDAWMPTDRIRFEVCGEPVLGIVDLAVPSGLGER